MNTFQAIMLSLAVVSMVLLIVSAIFYDKYWAALVGVTSFLILCSSCVAYAVSLTFEKDFANPSVITTTQPLQIDTTITIVNRVADTTYTYHIIRK